MSGDADGREVLGRDPSTWDMDQLRRFVEGAPSEELETPRVAAQTHAYNPNLPEESRRQWAKLSLLANRLVTAEGEGPLTRVKQQDFMLRMWVIDRLGPDDTDPDWCPEALAADTLRALRLTPAQAAALSDGWRDLPLDQIRRLRWHKNLTAHARCLLAYLPPGRTREQLQTWVSIRRSLP
ncbi:hypothetical protein [Streptomyces sp. NPDC054829]